MAQPKPIRSIPKIIGQPFITGVFGFLPLAITLAVLAWAVVFLHDLVGPSSSFGGVLQSVGFNFVACDVIAYIVGLIGTFVFIYFFGLLIEGGIGSRYERAVEVAMHRVPVVSTIYDASRQLTKMFEGSDDDVKAMTPVLCSFGRDGGTATLALLPSPKPVHIAGHDYLVVIIPTAPVPFGGALLCVPVDSVKPAGCSFDGLVNVFMSMGASAPDYLGKTQDAGREAEPSESDATSFND